MDKYIYKIILTNLKGVWIFFMVLTPLMAFISWLADVLPRLNPFIYYLNLLSVFTFPFISIIAIKYSWQKYEQNKMSHAMLIALAPALNILITIFCFNNMQYTV